MTTEIEKQFFETFGIEPKYKCNRDGNCYFQECSKCGWYIRTYPQITDRILLRLICLLSCEFGDKLSIKTLKKRMMQESMCCYNFKGKLNEKFKQKVRTLFKEAEE